MYIKVPYKSFVERSYRMQCIYFMNVERHLYNTLYIDWDYNNAINLLAKTFE